MVKIIADTTCGLPRQEFTRLGIPLIPQIIVFGDKSFRDDTEIDIATFLKKLKASPTLPKTAAPMPHLYFPVYEQAARDGESVVVVAPSAKVSGTVRAAEVAAQDFPNVDVRVVDTLTIAGNLGTLVLLADQWAKAGEDASTIVKRLNEFIPRGRMYFMVNTLEYLQKGGRIGGAKALLGGLLQVKPILMIKEGEVAPFEQQRTHKRALARLVEIVVDQCPHTSDAHLNVNHIGAEQEARDLAEQLKKLTEFSEIPIYELPPAIGVHGGPGVLAIGFFVA